MTYFHSKTNAVGTHMSFIKLDSGKFLVIDTCRITPQAKLAIDDLTQDGTLIEAVIATHPYHTLFFPAFYEMYPNAKYYGTPRHIRNFTNISWEGDVSNESIRRLWESHGIFMRIPDGAEFNNPSPDNHFSCCFVYHNPSRTIHVDDTIMYFESPGCILRCANKRAGKMEFWDLQKGLYSTPEAPIQFKMWVQQMLLDWDFVNLCTAHTGNRIGDAKICVTETLAEAEAQLNAIMAERSSTTSQ
jgi:hypothetical protein